MAGEDPLSLPRPARIIISTGPLHFGLKVKIEATAML